MLNSVINGILANYSHIWKGEFCIEKFKSFEYFLETCERETEKVISSRRNYANSVTFRQNVKHNFLRLLPLL